MNRMKRVGLTLFLVGIINFLAFFIVTNVVGGDAFNGKIQEGRYFLGYRGTYTEVGRFAYNCSYVHDLSIFITHPMAVIGLFLWSMAREHEQCLASEEERKRK